MHIPNSCLDYLRAQSRASLLLLLCFCVSLPHLTQAKDISEPASGSSSHGNDHNWYRLKEEESPYKFDLSDEQARNILLGPRQVTSSTTSGASPAASGTLTALPGNNTPLSGSIDDGQTQQFVFASKYVHGPKGNPGVGLPGQFDKFDDVGGDNLDFFSEELLNDDTSNEAVRQRRQSDSGEEVTVYVSINVCSQPLWTGTGDPPGPPPQLNLYVATNLSTVVGPNSQYAADEINTLDEGYAGSFTNITGDLNIAITAPTPPSGYTGGWTYSIAASIDDYYHDSEGGPSPLYLVDTDTSSALMVTDNVTQADPSDPTYQQWMNLNPVPFSMFTIPMSRLNALNGMTQSYCAVQKAALITGDPANAQAALAPVQMEMTTRGLGSKPKQQFYIRALNATMQYQTYLTMIGNSTASGPGVVGGGGKIWSATNLTTKTDGNCQLLFNLDFCDGVAYAVPANPFTYKNITALGEFYDSYATSLYANFSFSLQQVQCNATAAARYSLTRDCDDCAAAYKAWVCAVTIPRCMDWNTQLSYLQPRNVGQMFYDNSSYLPESELNGLYNPMPGAPVGSIADQQTLISTIAANQSRNSMIDQYIKPGPYKELLPCEDLCFDLVRDCHPYLGFTCPAAGRGREVGYGQKSNGPGVSCSFAGAVYQLGAAGRSPVPASVAVMIAALVAGLVGFM